MQSGSVTPPGPLLTLGLGSRNGGCLWGSICWSLVCRGGLSLPGCTRMLGLPRVQSCSPRGEEAFLGRSCTCARAWVQAGETSLLALTGGGDLPHPSPGQKHRASPTSATAVFAQSDLPVPILLPLALLSATRPRPCPRPLVPLPVPGGAGRAAGRSRGSAPASPLLTARFFSMNGQTVG